MSAATSRSLPALSVVLPAYNVARFLPRALESVLAQTYRDFELIVVDDGSTDGTLEIARAFARRDPRVRAVSQPHGRIAQALNHGIALARHEWIARMDGDDLMEPGRFERQLTFLAANPDLAATSSLAYYIDEEDRVLGRSRSPLTSRRTVARYHRQNRIVALNHASAIVRKDAVIAVGGYRSEFIPAEDCDLWGRMLEHGYQLLVQPEYLLRYRLYGSSTCGQSAVDRMRLLDWVTHCTILRRTGRPEIGFEAYQHQLERAPWWVRLNRRRAEHGLALWGRAVFLVSSRHYIAASALLLSAAVLRPALVCDRVGSRAIAAVLRLLNA
jgi:glycosyltransferase involved in cell wall biosynthesis